MKYENTRRIFERFSKIPERVSRWVFQIGEKYTIRKKSGRWFWML